jgi:predicted nuclease of predicted toxin-antitoxin system
MRFLIDAQLPPVLARWFQEQGYESRAVRDEGLRDADDSTIWRFALDNGWVIVTKDEDFAARSAQSKTGPQIVWVRIGNSTNRELVEFLNPLFTQILEALEAGNRLVEVKRN